MSGPEPGLEDDRRDLAGVVRQPGRPGDDARESAAVRTGKLWMPSRPSMSALPRPSGTWAGLLSPSVPRIDRISGNP